MSTPSPLIADLMQFLDASPVNFAAVSQCISRLEDAGFTFLDAEDDWNLRPGGKYYVVKNDSALIAFVMPSAAGPACPCHIIAAHSDSPGFRIKPHAAMLCEGNVVKLNTEVYGGPILYTWFDRPLSVAGRVMLRGNDALHPQARIIVIDRPLLTIPHLAIHFNRAVNDGNPLSRQKDMLPVVGHVNSQLEADSMLLDVIAGHMGVDKEEILDFDLSLYDTTPACTLGLHDEYLTSGRIDDLSMVHAAVTALISQAGNGSAALRVAAIFDNEETGSVTAALCASVMYLQLALYFITGPPPSCG